MQTACFLAAVLGMASGHPEAGIMKEKKSTLDLKILTLDLNILTFKELSYTVKGLGVISLLLPRIGLLFN